VTGIDLAPAPRPALAGRDAVLLVSDAQRLAAALQRCLECEGYAVVAVHDAGETLAYLTFHAPALILLDLSLGAIPERSAAGVADGVAGAVEGAVERVEVSGDASSPTPAADASASQWDAWEVYRHLRRDTTAPVIMLGSHISARDRENHLDALEGIAALEAGADDYVAQPCNPLEVAARVRAVLRRRRTAGSAPCLT
jgi:DNA-binding response OmpR family regulator